MDSRDKESIDGLVKNLVDAWNQRDVQAISKCFTKEAKFTSALGQVAQGPKEIGEMLVTFITPTFEEVFLPATKTKIQHKEFHKVAVEFTWETIKQTSWDHNKKFLLKKGLINLAIEKEHDDWRIAFGKNVDYAAKQAQTY
ncbi:hypothetical protein GCM10011571_34630 [Marinithermofilum abyssi]|uniref:SnoaL-like domain-containing protein n=1 Tax=Marinithermofilum abyssi TaxID=1571185 RepID=A0A8J2YFM0_9BACL|nr:SgcJ/EcaC family oxidoreductase [Marinithermofilum abyssi]GGE29567.1 hypothetical protein GCM10011571_34630 [Marinithermofilum abyssi]